MSDANTLTTALGGKWRNRYGVAPCPVCQPERRRDQSALTLTDRNYEGGLLLHCKKSGCDFRDILAAAGVGARDRFHQDRFVALERTSIEKAEAEKRSAQARRLWDECRPVSGTPAEAYLRGRAITCDLPATLRFHPDCWHATGRRFPAQVAPVDGADGF
jgi:hypothetical protein